MDCILCSFRIAKNPDKTTKKQKSNINRNRLEIDYTRSNKHPVAEALIYSNQQLVG